jgi:hypothetical protein
MGKINFTHLSTKNNKFLTKEIVVANGVVFVVLDLPEHVMLEAKNVLYIHVHRESKRCYIGQSLKKCSYRWSDGNGYKLANQPKFRSAINHYGWASFDSYLIAFCDEKTNLDAAEVECISAAGGHKSQYVFNLSAGGRAGGDRSEEIEGCNLKTGEWRSFDNSVEAAEFLNLQQAHNIRGVVKGRFRSAKGWWFRLAGSTSLPPVTWGLGSGVQQMKEVVAIHLIDHKELVFESISEAARAIGSDSSNVTRAVKRENGGVCNGY